MILRSSFYYLMNSDNLFSFGYTHSEIGYIFNLSTQKKKTAFKPKYNKPIFEEKIPIGVIRVF